jgi:hypothetical protein
MGEVIVISIAQSCLGSPYQKRQHTSAYVSIRQHTHSMPQAPQMQTHLLLDNVLSFAPALLVYIYKA